MRENLKFQSRPNRRLRFQRPHPRSAPTGGTVRTGDEVGFHIPGPYPRETMAFFSVQPRRLGGEICAEGALVLFGQTLFETD